MRDCPRIGSGKVIFQSWGWKNESVQFKRAFEKGRLKAIKTFIEAISSLNVLCSRGEEKLLATRFKTRLTLDLVSFCTIGALCLTLACSSLNTPAPHDHLTLTASLGCAAELLTHHQAERTRGTCGLA